MRRGVHNRRRVHKVRKRSRGVRGAVNAQSHLRSRHARPPDLWVTRVCCSALGPLHRTGALGSPALHARCEGCAKVCATHPRCGRRRRTRNDANRRRRAHARLECARRSAGGSGASSVSRAWRIPLKTRTEHAPTPTPRKSFCKTAGPGARPLPRGLVRIERLTEGGGGEGGKAKEAPVSSRLCLGWEGREGSSRGTRVWRIEKHEILIVIRGVHYYPFTF